MTSTAVATRQPDAVAGINIDWPAVWKTLRLDPQDPRTQALLLVCDRYGLDPLLKHAVIVEGNVYITRDGLLHVAHKSGVFDGIEVVDGPDKDAQGDWHAKVSVWRKDMNRPTTYPGRYPAAGKNAKFRPEMAIKVAEVMALRRAFDVAVSTLEEQWDRAADSGQIDPATDLDRTAADEDHRRMVGDVETFAGQLERNGVIDADQRAKAVEYAQRGVDQAELSMSRLSDLAADDTPVDVAADTAGEPDQQTLEEPTT